MVTSGAILGGSDIDVFKVSHHGEDTNRSPMMPTGLLIFCLEYAKAETKPLGGLFTSIRNRFADLANAAAKELLDEFYEFRNSYIAHYRETTRTALQVRIQTFQALATSQR